MKRRGRRARIVAVLVGGLALAGCTASTRDGAHTDTPSPVPPSSTSTSSSSAPRTTAVPSPSTSSSSATATPSSVPPAPAAVTPRSTCAHVTIRVIRGSAAQGIEFAALQFTNAGTASCELFGYPKAMLRSSGKAIGSAAQPATSAASHYTLRPGDTAESRLTDYVNCQAPLSDAIRVVVPGSDIHTIRPAQLRACVLRVGKLGLPE